MIKFNIFKHLPKTFVNSPELYVLHTAMRTVVLQVKEFCFTKAIDAVRADNHVTLGALSRVGGYVEAY